MLVQLLDVTDAQLWADYIYLDTDERRRFAQVSHEYLIEQVQHTSGSDASLDLNFNHPVKELVWAPETAAWWKNNSFRLVLNAKLFLMDMIALLKDPLNTSHKLKYGNTTPVHQLIVIMVLLVQEKLLQLKLLFTRLLSNPKNTNHPVHATSRELTMLNLKFWRNSSNTVNVYAVNYNVLRVMSGMGGLAYSN